MGFLIFTIVALLIGFVVVRLFLTASPTQIAGAITKTGPAALIALGALLTFVGRGGFGIPMIGIGLALWQRTRSVGTFTGRGPQSSSSRTSKVRSRALEMEMDLDSGEMNGRVLAGSFTGQFLADMAEDQLIELYQDLGSDPENAALLEAYLDRRIVGWRENADTNRSDGQGHAPASGSMTKQEAYQVLGLEPGASKAEIRQAWRKLMKSVHPDSGGSQFLAAKINAAKDILLN